MRPQWRAVPGGAAELLGGRSLALLRLPDHEDPGDSPRPVLHPLSTPGGTIVTDLSPTDHSWHRGLSFAIANIRVPGVELPVNVWGGVTYHGHDYVQLDNNGQQRVIESTVYGDTWRAAIEWCTSEGAAFLAEERSIQAWVDTDAAGESYLRLRWVSRCRNLSAGELGLGSPTTAGRPAAGYGGLFLRGAEILAGAAIIAADHGIVPEPAAMGIVASWMALRGQRATVVIAADTPTPWFVRSSPHPMLCAAPFFSTEVVLAAGEVIDLAWDVLVTDELWNADNIEREVAR